jgi:acyl carrier protein
MTMTTAASIETVLIDYLQSRHVGQEPIDTDTDLIDSAVLDSLLVMDLVCFLTSRFGIEMTPGDITPDNLGSVARMGRFVQAKQGPPAKAA